MESCKTKHSKKRDVILALIRSVRTHPTAAWVYEEARKAIPHLSLGTVYRNINHFQDEGSVISVGVVNGEERFDGRVSPHPHLICETCGLILDSDESTETLLIPPETSAVDVNGFKIDYRKTIFYGICDQCVKNTD